MTLAADWLVNRRRRDPATIASRLRSSIWACTTGGWLLYVLSFAPEIGLDRFRDPLPSWLALFVSLLSVPALLRRRILAARLLALGMAVCIVVFAQLGHSFRSVLPPFILCAAISSTAFALEFEQQLAQSATGVD